MEQIFNRFMNAEFLILYSNQILKKKHHHEVVVTNGEVNNGQWTSEQALLHYNYYYWLVGAAWIEWLCKSVFVAVITSR